MKFIGIEYDHKDNSNHIKGYVRVPDGISSRYISGYLNYIKDVNKAINFHVYPLNIKLNSDNMGKAIPGYINLEDEFNLALRSNKYFPISTETDAFRRAWSMMDPESPDFGIKER